MHFDSVWWMLGGAIAGLIAGSFISTLAIRWPRDETLTGRSRCDGCGRSLSITDLIPLIGYLAARGRCVRCGVAIDIRHPTIEVAAMLIGICTMLAAPSITGIAGAMFGWQLLTLATLDIEHFWLPDRLTGLLALTGLLFTVALDRELLISRLVGGGTGFAVLFLISFAYERFRGRAGMGAGDPKLLGAIGLWLGWAALPYVLIAAGFLGLAGAAAMAVRGRSITSDTRLPFGALLAVAAFPIWMVTLP
jgi:leader peptidase (prepilin peptidase) / N-methyltransferase